MHWLDTLMLTALGLGAVLGFVSGLFWQVARIGSLAAAVGATVYLHDDAVQMLREMFLREADASIVKASAYVAVFLIVYTTLYLLTRVIHMWLRATDLAFADRLLGAVLGAAKIAFLLGTGCLLLRHASHPAAQEWLERSTLAPVFARGMEHGIALVPDQVKQPVLDSIRQLQEAMARPQGKTKEN